MWRNTDELLADIYEARKRMLETGDINTAHAECRFFAQATKAMAVALAHGQMTNRLTGDRLPLVTFGEARAPGLPAPAQSRPALAKSKRGKAA